MSCNEDEFSWEKQEKQALEMKVYELRREKEELKKKEKENLFVSKHDRAIDYSRCLVCGATGFNTLNDLVLHYQELHEKKLGITYAEFVQRYPTLVKKMLDRANKETAKRLQLDFDAEMFQRALRTPLPDRNDLSRMGRGIAKKSYEELVHTFDVQHTCPICKKNTPFFKINESTGEIEESDNSVREHINTQIRLGDSAHTELAKHFNNMRALSQGKNPYKEEKSKESLSRDVNSALVESTTEKAQIEQLSESKSNLGDKNLLKIFGEEVYAELSKKKKKGIGRKTVATER